MDLMDRKMFSRKKKVGFVIYIVYGRRHNDYRFLTLTVFSVVKRTNFGEQKGYVYICLSINGTVPGTLVYTTIFPYFIPSTDTIIQHFLLLSS